MPRKQHKTHRKQRGAGGNMEGTFGKVFRPALPCVGAAGQRPPNHVSKVSKRGANAESVAFEWRVSQELGKIPGIEHYFAFADQSCDVNLTHITPANRFNASVMRRKPTGAIGMFQVPDGGDDVYKSLHLTAADYIPFFMSLTNLFEGLSFLHEHQVAHRDIKPLNVVSKKMGDGSFQTKYIDPGMSIFLNIDYSGTAAAAAHNELTFLNEYNTQYFYGATSYMPFDLVLLYTVRGMPRYDDIPYSLNQTGPRAYAQWASSQLKFFNIVPFETIDQNGNPSAYPDFATMRTELSNSLYRNAAHDNIATIIKAADVWMLGFTLMAVWTRLTNLMVIQYESSPGHIQEKLFMIADKFTSEIGDDALSLDDLPQILVDIGLPDLIPADTIKWYRHVGQDVITPLHAICMAMMAVKPEDRITIDEALGRYIALAPAFRRYFTEDQVARHFSNLRIIKGVPAAVAAGGAAAAGGGGGGARVATPAPVMNKPTTQQNNYVAVNVAPAGVKKQEGGRRSKKTRRSRK